MIAIGITKYLFPIKIIIGIKKTLNFMLIQKFIELGSKSVPDKIYRRKTLEILSFSDFALFSYVFC
jgi:hypothetical protein